MIKINLAPVDELENRLWFVPDLLVALLAFTIGYFGVQLALTHWQDEITAINTTTAEIAQNTKRLKPDLARFDQLQKQVSLLREKIKILTNLTVSKVQRYEPIIVLEAIQNLIPKGVWLTNLSDDSEHSVISLDGGAFDPLLISEFMSALNTTRSQNLDPSDIRTAVFFDKVQLGRVYSGEYSPVASKNDAKNDQRVAAFRSAQDPALQSQDKGTAKKASHFPEISDFPVFNLRLKYAERGPNAANAGQEEEVQGF